jgi:hypothetical protein
LVQKKVEGKKEEGEKDQRIFYFPPFGLQSKRKGKKIFWWDPQKW